MAANQLIAMDEGRIARIGSPGKLIAENRVFKDLVDGQISKQRLHS
jgi:ABC-type multidrug transport system fused ATPase/permease subunit